MNAVRDVLLAEYNQMKTEQHDRIGVRDNLLYATMTAIAGVLAAVGAGHGITYLLLVPPVCLVLGWTYLANDEMISAIGRYVRDELAPRLAEVTASPVPLLNWEHGTRHDPVWRSRKAGQLIVDLLAFAVPPAAAVTAYWISQPGRVLLLAVSAAEALAVALYSARVIYCFDLRTRHTVIDAGNVVR
jgi:hypothetical protein